MDNMFFLRWLPTLKCKRTIKQPRNMAKTLFFNNNY